MKQKEVLLIGAEWCPDCVRVKHILEAQGVTFTYKNVDDGQQVIDEMLALSGGKHLIPTLQIADQVLQNPDNHQLLEALGIEAKSEHHITTHDLVIIGAGPAALSAAIYTTREDIDTVLFEKGAIGGLAAVTDWVDNYPGFPDGVSGMDLSENLRKQAERFGAVIELGEVTSISDAGRYKRLQTTSGDYYAKAVLLATGSEYKKINVPGEIEFYGRGVHYCATCDGAFYRDKRLVVVGGGNSAVQEGIFLTKFASHIDLLVRGPALRASEVLQHELEAHADKITVHMNTTTDAIIGEENKVVKVRGTDKLTGQPVEFATDGVFIFVGLKPNTEFLKDSGIELDETGFVTSDKHLETSLKGVFVAGDVRSGATMQIASATGEGATAALMIRKYLEDKLKQTEEHT